MLPKPYCTRREAAAYLRVCLRTVDTLLTEAVWPLDGRIRITKTQFKAGKNQRVLLHSADVLAILPEPKEVA